MLRLSIRFLKFALVLAVLGYASVAALMWYKQRDLLFNFQNRGIGFETVALADTRLQWLQTADSVRLETFYHPPRKGRPIVLYFHGKGTSLANEQANLRRLAKSDFGFLGVSYRGAGNSTGEASEEGMITDALTAYDWLRTQGHSVQDIMVLGQSLGTGVAVQLAAKRPVAAVALGAPYSSVVDVAAERYWFLPVRLLMIDQFLSDSYVAHIKAPLLMLHGAEDKTIPVRFGERLFAIANHPKRFTRVAGEGHALINKDEAFLAYAAFFNSVFVKTLAAQ